MDKIWRVQVKPQVNNKRLNQASSLKSRAAPGPLHSGLHVASDQGQGRILPGQSLRKAQGGVWAE